MAGVEDLRLLAESVLELARSTQALAQRVRDEGPPTVSVAAPQVDVHTPEQRDPVVNVTLPEMRPTLEVKAPVVNVAAPVIPPMPTPTIEVTGPLRAFRVIRDDRGFITGLKQVPYDSMKER